MNALFLVSALVGALLHVGFFVLESVLFTKPPGRKVFGVSEADAETMKFLAFNQGFYNLFLALGVVTGAVLVVMGRADAGKPIVAFGCACMVGAACVLATGGKRMMRGVLAQGIPPLVALAALFAGG
jgi:putative membrane protein